GAPGIRLHASAASLGGLRCRPELRARRCGRPVPADAQSLGGARRIAGAPDRHGGRWTGVLAPEVALAAHDSRGLRERDAGWPPGLLAHGQARGLRPRADVSLI